MRSMTRGTVFGTSDFSSSGSSAARISRCLGMTAGLLLGLAGTGLAADEAAKTAWSYSADLLRPFWDGTIMEGESVLFVRDVAGKPAKASVIFPISQVLAVRNSAGDITYQ